MYYSPDKRTILLSIGNINSGNRTEWSPIRSVIIGVIDKISKILVKGMLENQTKVTQLSRTICKCKYIT